MSAPYDGEVQFGRFDVPAEVLNAPGQRLEHLIGVQAAAIVSAMLGQPPDDGWRLIAGDLDSPAENQPVLAAPWDNPRGDGWMVISLSHYDDAWGAVVHGAPHPIRPSRASRRAGLELAWSPEADRQMGRLRADTRLDDVDMILQNTSTQPWVNQHLDYDGIFISVSDEHGRHVTNSHRDNDWGIVGHPVEPLPTIQPGAEITLTAHFEAATAHYGLRPGKYALIASMSSLELRTQPLLVSVPPTPEAPH